MDQGITYIPINTVRSEDVTVSGNYFQCVCVLSVTDQ